MNVCVRVGPTLLVACLFLSAVALQRSATDDVALDLADVDAREAESYDEQAAQERRGMNFKQKKIGEGRRIAATQEKRVRSQCSGSCCDQAAFDCQAKKSLCSDKAYMKRMAIQCAVTCGTCAKAAVFSHKNKSSNKV